MNAKNDLGPQHYAIIEYLKAGHSLTPIEAIKIAGSMKLSSRVGELRTKGYNIQSEWIKTDTGKKVKKYWIEPKHEPVFMIKEHGQLEFAV